MEQKLMSKNIKNIAYSTAIKLSDYNKIIESSKEEQNYMEIDGEKFYIYNDLSLSHGLPALCILYGELNELYPEEGWDIKGHEYMKKIGELLEEGSNILLSMFAGLSGIGLAAVCLSKGGTRYKDFINYINELIKNNLNELLDFLKNKSSVSIEDYDAISGVSGILNYCMLFKDDMEEEITMMLNYIVDLCKDKEFMSVTVPGWYITSENQFTEEEKNTWKNGCFNMGLSHGIPSLLINLCNANKLNIKVPGQKESIRKIAKFLFNHRSNEKNEQGWDYVISFESYKNNIKNSECCRDAWCYGTPGVAYSLLIAGDALNNKEYIDCAIKSMKIAGRRAKHTYSPTFCHGYSGIAYISNKFYELTNIDEFKCISLNLCKKILSFYDETNMFNFQDIEDKDGELHYYNSVGILEGVSGIILTLLAIKEGRKTPWDTAFSLGDYNQRF